MGTMQCNEISGNLRLSNEDFHCYYVIFSLVVIGRWNCFDYNGKLSFFCGRRLRTSFSLFLSEFDQFLADRAAAGGMRSGSVKGGSNRPKQRQMQMENQADDEMFGLWFNCENTFFFQTITLVLKRSSAVKELYKRIMNVCFETRILVIDIFVKELL